MIPGVADQGQSEAVAGHIPRSRLYDYVEMTAPDTSGESRPPADPPPVVQLPPPHTSDGPSGPPTSRAVVPEKADEVVGTGREFAALLGEFRRTAVLVPITEDGSPLAGDFDGIRWIYAFSNESTLARFAITKGEGAREWPYRRVLGARLLDAAVPATGVPCGVALDVASDGDGVLFPPVVGIVPTAAAVDAETVDASEEESR
ncbi:hypothetical protein [Streptomyces sp. V4I2]|uniref:hypothetical protein n=1 Tax=Streptomyces sp. V4I2 TaxID=3042280 RepID=UPI002785BE56|nr:hypothetical protein [Streptomyces sp. V4I2]MDQ1048253.1 hypothetical protein [Streptomyces sp. V4I2]